MIYKCLLFSLLKILCARTACFAAKSTQLTFSWKKKSGRYYVCGLPIAPPQSIKTKTYQVTCWWSCVPPKWRLRRPYASPFSSCSTLKHKIDAQTFDDWRTVGKKHISANAAVYTTCLPFCLLSYRHEVHVSLQSLRLPKVPEDTIARSNVCLLALALHWVIETSRNTIHACRPASCPEIGYNFNHASLFSFPLL